ncbi:hypothetical protein DH2020_022856 [Rehmannia glutinosa]|uniref:Uncharacterized protein n=1 Tax=Rehmannia glutinosa TaxID=99300 RepID=A0ABR0W4C9_REHGL
MGGATAVSDHSSKPKSREVSSRFLSPTSSSTTSSSTEYGNQSPNSTLISSPKQKPKSSTGRSRKHKSYENSGFFRGLWPSSSIPSPSSNSKLDTLANHLGHDRLKDLEERKNNKLKSDQNSFPLSRQKSCTEFSRFENEKKIYASAKENQKPVYGGSMRYTGKFKFTGKSPDDNNDIVPGRFSVDENTLRKNHFPEEDYYYRILMIHETLNQNTATYIPAARVSTLRRPEKIFRRHIWPQRSRRWSADSGLNQKAVSSDNNSNSPKIFTLKNAMKKAAHGNWALSPGRSGKKSSSSVSSPLGPGSAENVHQLRLLHNRLMQWRYSNARAEAVNGNVIKQAESSFVNVWNGLIKLRVPLVDGAKVESQSASIAVRHASDLAASIHLMLTTFSPTIEERSLRSSIMQLKLLQQHHHQQQYILA